MLDATDLDRIRDIVKEEIDKFKSPPQTTRRTSLSSKKEDKKEDSK